MNFLIVDFYKTATDKMCFRYVIFSDSDDLTESSGNDTFQLFVIRNTHHGMRLTTTSLSICENSSIIPIENAVNQWESTLFINERLWRICSEYFIITETFRWLIIVLFDEIDLIVLKINLNDIDAPWNLDKMIPLYFSFPFIGLQRTMTLTASDI